VKNSLAVSVILPVFNGEQFVSEAIESILNQDFKDIELIIINDGSTDKSSELLRDYADTNQCIRLIERENKGLVETLNEAVGLSKAKFIARMDADDIACPHRLRLQYETLKKSPNLAVLGSFINLIDEKGQFIRLGSYPVSPEEVANYLENACPIAHPSVMMRKESVIKAGGYRKAFSHCEDYDLWLRISELGYQLANYPEPLLNYRIHDNNVSHIYRVQQELGSNIARLAHRARKAGLSDPCANVERLVPQLIQSFPEYLRKDIEASFFVSEFSVETLNSGNKIKAMWGDYLNLPLITRKEKIMGIYLLGVLKHFLQSNHYLFACRILVALVFTSPIIVTRFAFNKLAITLKIKDN